MISGDGLGAGEADTVQCCHCGRHYAVKPGSGKTRGFCMKCMAPTCGSERCDTCIPQEKMLEEIERNWTRNARYRLAENGAYERAR